MEVPEHEARIAAIVAEGRATRRLPSRGSWLAGASIGAICAIGFVLLLARHGEPGERVDAAGREPPAGAAARPGEPARAGGAGAGWLGGLGLGLGLGLAIGLAIARRQSADHSSRKRP